MSAARGKRERVVVAGIDLTDEMEIEDRIAAAERIAELTAGSRARRARKEAESQAAKQADGAAGEPEADETLRPKR